MLDIACAWSLNAAALAITESRLAISELKVSNAGQAGANLAKQFGIDWPDKPNRIVAGPPNVATLAPGEWAIFARILAISEGVEKACAEFTYNLVDVSAGRRAWSLTGPNAGRILAKGCSLDIGSWSPGNCAQSLLAQIPVLLLPSTVSASEDPGFLVVADASFALYLREWFSDAAAEFDR